MKVWILFFRDGVSYWCTNRSAAEHSRETYKMGEIKEVEVTPFETFTMAEHKIAYDEYHRCTEALRAHQDGKDE